MIGTLTDRLVEYLRQLEIVEGNNIPVVVTNSLDGRRIKQSGLPCVAITINPSHEPTTYIGGLIEDRIRFNIVVLNRLVNYTLSGETEIYIQDRDLAYDLRSKLFSERNGEFFQSLREEFNFLPMYRGLQDFIKVGYLEDTEEDLEYWQMCFECVMVDNRSVNRIHIPMKSAKMQWLNNEGDPTTPVPIS